VEDRFDSLQYLHLRSHGCLQEAGGWRHKSHLPLGWFYQSPALSQSELVSSLLKRALTKETIDLFIYCHNHFPEDLHHCQLSWIQDNLKFKAESSFAVEYQGGVNIAIALKELQNMILAEQRPISGVLAGAERILLPYRRDAHPLGWLSDMAVLIQFSTKKPTSRPAYEVRRIVDNYDGTMCAPLSSQRTHLMENLLEMSDSLLRDLPQDSYVVYPAYDEDVLRQLQALHPGITWQGGRYGMSYGLEHIAAMTDKRIKSYEQIILLFLEAGVQGSAVLLQKVS
jgi:hypothetical protein